jgi:hypothetical protein
MADGINSQNAIGNRQSTIDNQPGVRATYEAEGETSGPVLPIGGGHVTPEKTMRNSSRITRRKFIQVTTACAATVCTSREEFASW